MAELILFHKPFRVLSQFSDKEGRPTLADFLSAPGFRVAGRLDYDSEGLLLLTKDGRLQQQIANPRYKLWKTYLVQVEGEISERALQQLSTGVVLRDGPTLPARARHIPEPVIPERVPAVRLRKSVPDSWLELSIREGRNRQVRHMTAAVGFPTLRLIRSRIGNWSLNGLPCGHYRTETVHMPQAPSRTGNTARRKR